MSHSPPLQSLDGKVAVVTGGASGFGRAAAECLAQAGTRVALVDRVSDRAEQAAQEIAVHGAEVLAITADIASPEQVRDIYSQVDRRWGQTDIVFANAGINGAWAPIEDLEPDEWDETQRVNLRGAFLTLKYAIPQLKKRGGSVIFTSSVSGTSLFNNIGASAYAASKGGLVSFAKMAALELSGFGIRVNVICPGSFKTDIFSSTRPRNTESLAIRVNFPDRRIPLVTEGIMDPMQIGNVVLFLASDLSAYMTGAEIRVDGGQTLLGI